MNVTARLDACQAEGGSPTRIRFETKAGQGAGKPMQKLTEEAADKLAFITHDPGGK